MDIKNVERLMMFLELAEQGSFTKATEKLGISKGYMSKQIKALEEELKTKLVVRSTRHMRLTAEGQRAYNHGVGLRKQIQAFQGNVQEENQRISGVLRLTAPKMFTEVFLVDICNGFRQLHPEIKIELNSSFTRYDLLQDEIDIAIRATNTPPDDIVAKKLFSYKHILVGSPEYFSQKGIPHTPSDLKNHQCLTTLHQQNWPLQTTNLPVTGWISMNDNHVLKKQALQHQGIIRVPSYYVVDEIQQGLLIEALSTSISTQENTFYMLYPQFNYVPAKLKAFISFTQNYFKDS